METQHVYHPNISPIVTIAATTMLARLPDAKDPKKVINTVEVRYSKGGDYMEGMHL